MPTLLHEALIALFRNRPTLAAEVLRGALGVDVPAFSKAHIEESDLTTITPTSFAADLVVSLRRDETVLGVVVEVQLDVDKNKPASWFVYMANLYAKLEAPVVLLVIATSERVAKWCARPISYGHPGFVLRPLVLGPASVPVVTDENEAAEAPELAVLSALAHSQSEHAFTVGKAALHAASLLDDDRARLYFDLVLTKSAAKEKLEEYLMIPSGYRYQSDFAKRWMAVGREEGREKGLEEGRVEAKAEALIVFLKGRGFPVTEAVAKQIRDCDDATKLDLWIGRAATAASLAEALED